MDVRCERCQTIYEFEDARLKEGGVTVKCTRCNHVFKVYPGAQPRPRTLPGVPFTEVEPPSPAPQVPRLPFLGGVLDGFEGRPADTGSQRMWMLRPVGAGEVRRFRDLTTLQQWIVEMKVVREDEISRDGERWKPLSGIAELEPFFRIVDQARAATRPNRSPEPPRAVPLPPALEPEPGRRVTRGDTRESTIIGLPPGAAAAGPAALARRLDGEPAGEPYTEPPEPPGPIDEPIAQSRPEPEPASAVSLSPVPDPDEEPPDFRPGRRRPSMTAIAAALTVLLLVGLAGYLALYKRSALSTIVAGGEGARGREQLRKGREYFLLDTEDDFHRADQQFQRAQGADESNPLPVAALVELNATWARHLREEARLLRPGAPLRADELQRQAQTRIDEARRYASEARSLAPADPDVNRALADLRVLEGAPASQVEEALRGVEARRPEDPEARYVRGTLAVRDGRLDEGRQLLEQASRLNRQETQHDLLRADYVLAVVEAQAGFGEQAKALARRILDANPHHALASALLSSLEAPPSAPGAAEPPAATPAPTPLAATAGPVAPVAMPAVAAPAAAAPVPAADPSRAMAILAATTPSRSVPGPSLEARDPHGYQTLCEAGNRLLEHGHGREAMKLFQRALGEDPGGLEAQNGLGWALLDTEHYNAAADRFKKVLAVMPGNGEALIGLAEVSKLRGDGQRALEFYKRYLVELPDGSKASMAQANVRELEDALRRKELPAAAEPRDAQPLPPPPPVK